MMTSRERVEAAFAHRIPDRTPIFEYVLCSPVADQLLGRPYAVDETHWPEVVDALGWERAVRQRALDYLDLAQLLGHDLIYVTRRNVVRPNISRSAPPVPEPEPPDDPVEFISQRNRQRREEWTPPSDDDYLVYHLLRDEMRRRDFDLPILAPACSHGIWTDTDLMQTMILAPELAHEHFQIVTRATLANIEKYISAGVDQITVGGDFAGNRPIISPDCYRTFIVPEVRKCSRRIHQAGLKSVNASDGNLWPVIDDFFFGCEVDGYVEIDMHAGMDLGRLKKSFGDRITFYGNLDCGNILSFGSSEQIRRHVIATLEAGMGNGGHVLCASNAVTASISLDNYLTVVNTYRDFFSLPSLSI